MSGGRHSRAKELAWSLLYTLCTVHVVTNYVVDVTMTQGPSMTPTIDERYAVALYVRPHLLRALRSRSPTLYREGDVVIGISPTNASRRICKRVRATEFERHGGRIVPRGHVWLEGDNKANSLDSRYYGAVSSHILLGRVFLILSPNQGVRFV
ncbi:hypothetical protein, conserved [Babesia bigemina]|uniref:Peptidase S26 domain-containing protein n=1 Tax=Babesia bigemina TaxID=5866 RepID=A0A061DER1_BABBI|nr:hypothetical protein, conserved [Babesia bigemina]CDR97720.1 hypothetical protein, conserved [Babesia bigemina]|eukprot:XP_012769906.1 hypothetical protein, conserved [Babesia bigemina]